MKLLIIAAAFPPMKSGGADYAMRLASCMADQGMEVHVLTTSGASANETAYSVKPLIDRWSWKDAITIHEVVKELKPDIVDIHFTGWVYNDHPMITFAPAVVKHAHPDTHLSVHVESLGGVRRDRNNILNAGVRWLVSQTVGRQEINFEYGNLIRDSDTVIFLNQRDRHELTLLCPGLPDKSMVAPPPPIMPVSPPLTESEIQSIRTEYGMEDREILLAYYGYVYPGKGLETLLSTVYQVAAQKKDVGLLIIGGLPDQRVLDRAGRHDYLDELKSSAETLTISQRLRWIGYSPAGSELPSRLLRACDMCVLPFDNGVMLNNSSFSFAAMHGMPIVSTYGQHTENVFVNGQNALLLPPCHAVQLAQAIIKLAEDGAMKEKLSAGALTLANERFSWQATVNDTIRFWSSQKAKNVLSIA